VIKNAMKSWKAIGSWTDAYLKEKIGDKLMKVRAKLFYECNSVAKFIICKQSSCYRSTRTTP
jgi:hypothetical protein